jgi:hypothetical protein
MRACVNKEAMHCKYNGDPLDGGVISEAGHHSWKTIQSVVLCYSNDFLEFSGLYANVYKKQMLVVLLVVWCQSFAPHEMLMNVCAMLRDLESSICMLDDWWAFADKGFWAVWDNIYAHMCLLLQMFRSFLTGNLPVIHIVFLVTGSHCSYLTHF